MADRTVDLRHSFARSVTRRGGVQDPRIETAFATVPREPFAGPGPWSIFTGGSSGRNAGYVQTADDDPAFLYQDTLIALDPARGINIGEPSLHACCLDALSLQPGETVLHVGAGSGYYTALLAHLVGRSGHVHAYEIDPDLAERAERNLADRPQVTLYARSGIVDDLPKVNAVYVSAGITQPSRAWLDALLPSGRLLFPLQPEGGFGGMLMITRPRNGHPAWPARFVSRASFISCQGPQVAAAGRALSAVFASGGWEKVRALRLDGRSDGSCWLKGNGWWLSTNAPAGSQDDE